MQTARAFPREAIKSMETMDRLTPYCDFVFTGGEPLANLESLQQMLDKVSLTHKVYINTTLPVSQTQTEEEILAFWSGTSRRLPVLTFRAICSISSRNPMIPF